MAALQYVDVPGYSALLVRRTYADLSKPGALIHRAHEWLTGSGAKWNERDKQWTFPSGAILSFGYLETPIDRYRFQGAEYQFIGIDEISQLEEDSYTYLFSRLRRLKDSPVPVLMRCASNPGGIGADWVKERFIPDEFTVDDAIECKVWEKEGKDGEVRAFVPARLADNAALDQEEYRKALFQLDEVTGRQLLLGDWSVKQKGNIFPDWSDGKDGYHVITWSQFEKVFNMKEIPLHWNLAIGHDFGTTKGHPAVVTCIATSAENSKHPGLYFVVWSKMLVGATADGVAETIRLALEEYHMDPEQVQMWRMSHEANSERLVYQQKYNYPLYAGKHGKTDGIAQMQHLLKIGKDDHLFKGIEGTPRLFFIVDDDQLENPKDDRGLRRIREEMAEYKWGETTPTEARGQSVPVPRKYRDDAIDSMRFVFSEWGPGIEPLSPDEVREGKLLPEYQKSYIAQLTGNALDFHLAMRDWELADIDKQTRERDLTTYDRFFKGTI